MTDVHEIWSERWRLFNASNRHLVDNTNVAYALSREKRRSYAMASLPINLKDDVVLTSAVRDHANFLLPSVGDKMKRMS